MPSATVSLLRFCELTIGDIRTDWCSSRSSFGASRGRSQSKRRSQSSIVTPEAIAFFFCQPKTLFSNRDSFRDNITSRQIVESLLIVSHRTETHLDTPIEQPVLSSG